MIVVVVWLDPQSPELRIMKLKASIKLMLILPLFLLSRRCGHHRLSFCKGPHPAVGPDTVFHCSQSSELTLPASWARRHPQIKDNGTETSLLFQTSVTSPSLLPTASWPRRASASRPTNGSIPWSNPGQPSGALSNTQPRVLQQLRRVCRRYTVRTLSSSSCPRCR